MSSTSSHQILSFHQLREEKKAKILAYKRKKAELSLREKEQNTQSASSVNKGFECNICFMKNKTYGLLTCCKQKICGICYNKVTKCPFCRKQFNKLNPKIMVTLNKRYGYILFDDGSPTILGNSLPEQYVKYLVN